MNHCITMIVNRWCSSLGTLNLRSLSRLVACKRWCSSGNSCTLLEEPLVHPNLTLGPSPTQVSIVFKKVLAWKPSVLPHLTIKTPSSHMSISPMRRLQAGLTLHMLTKYKLAILLNEIEKEAMAKENAESRAIMEIGGRSNGNDK